MSRIGLSIQTKLMTQEEFWALLWNGLVLLEYDYLTSPAEVDETVEHYEQKRARVRVALDLLDRMKPQ